MQLKAQPKLGRRKIAPAPPPRCDVVGMQNAVTGRRHAFVAVDLQAGAGYIMVVLVVAGEE